MEINFYKLCYIELQGNLWYICWPDGTKAWVQGYKSKKASERVLNWLVTSERKVRNLTTLNHVK